MIAETRSHFLPPLAGPPPRGLFSLVLAPPPAPVSSQTRDRTPETLGSENDLSLIAAAEKGDLVGIANAMRGGGSIAARDKRGRNAVLAATYGNHVPAALFLMAAGSDVNAKDDQE